MAQNISVKMICIFSPAWKTEQTSRRKQKPWASAEDSNKKSLTASKRKHLYIFDVWTLSIRFVFIWSQNNVIGENNWRNTEKMY